MPQHRPLLEDDVQDKVLDAAQEQAWQHLQRIRDDLLAAPPRPARSHAFTRWLRRAPTPAEPVRGLYLWGDVGRGKTFLVDRFFEALPLEDKLRLHFHRFMQRVHAELKTLKDQPDPIRIVSHRLATARVLCLDEFFVSDITDAVLLHRLLAGLMENGVTLITTSNIPPRALYKDGLQRELFLPAIDILQRHLEVVHLDGAVDYRLRALEQAEIYHAPLDDEAGVRLNEAFQSLAPEPGTQGGALAVEGRQIPVQRLADGVVWFHFKDICDGPRSQLDYVEIAREFHTVLISGLPVMDAAMENAARRFLALVDEFYDRKVKLIISAEARPEQIYQGQRLRFEYQRCVSRLLEMQSRAYLASPHLP
ncbi:cell division protein ZapE [Ectothiorhodospira lacustris]|uniref:cell division protein ZapE n=1 Tax=Ectothiorhodospira lacustris TaxID=2899127 RepID=UPI001EE83668|nr:cell division protein ZapE [Ectothiorhodospira lacustris]MCG5511210.1 cell division protein ZapE [Ectothiorhodospira lacustris]MCG5522974.1 cell division protein ZapE [Ectothiorhodospira lacustris]